MIDRDSRDRLATALRRLASGGISVREFDELSALPRRDPAIHALWCFGWLHYDDLWINHRLRGRRALNAQARRRFAQAVLFLKSDQEYGYRQPSFGLSARAWITIAASALAGLAIFDWKWEGAWVSLGMAWLLLILIPPAEVPEESSWPFADDDSLGQARSRPVLLARGSAGSGRA